MLNGIFRIFFIFSLCYWGFVAYAENNQINDQFFTITFDDGPHPKTTENLLKQLKQRGIKKAIFFIMGEHALQYPDLVKQIDEYGYDIGYHSMHHTNQALMTKDDIYQDINEFKTHLNEILGKTYPLKYGRPPFGGMTKESVKVFSKLKKKGDLSTQSLPDDIFNAKLVAEQVVNAYQEHGLRLLLWNVDFNDWEKRIDIKHARNQFVPHLNQIWLFHEMPSYKGRIFDNQITHDIPAFFDFLCEHYC